MANEREASFLSRARIAAGQLTNAFETAATLCDEYGALEASFLTAYLDGGADGVVNSGETIAALSRLEEAVSWFTSGTVAQDLYKFKK